MPLEEWKSATAAVGLNPDPAVNEHWSELQRRFSAGVKREARGPLAQILAVARASGCRTVVQELRYVDLDYRSEYSNFWSRRFESRPELTSRLHFFTRELAADDLPMLPEDPGYLGYSILRPTELGPVGRTVLCPPPDLAAATLTSVRETPTLFGNPLPFEGVPFYQQDGEVMRCAHVVAWISHYVGFRRGIVGRIPSGDLAAMSFLGSTPFRPLPAAGLTVEQIQAMLTTIGLPAIVHRVNALPPVPGKAPGSAPSGREGPPRRIRYFKRRDCEERIRRVICKYLNSGFPVIVTTADHAFTVVGWERRGDDVRLIACDDQKGPFTVIDKPLSVRSRDDEWRLLIIPVPDKVFLTGEAAERRALDILRVWSGEGPTRSPELHRLVRQVKQGGKASVRAKLIEGKTYKARLLDRDLPDEVVRVFRLADLSHWVWLVEVHERALRDRGGPCVRAEMALGSTSHDDNPSVHLIASPPYAVDVSAYSEGAVAAADLPDRPWESLISRD